MKNINEMTKKELMEIPFLRRDEATWFNGFIVVPLLKVHDSGWRCMKFILLQDGNIIGSVGGYSDVIVLLKNNWKVDCLCKSKLLRFFNNKHYNLSEIYVGSDFILD